MDRCEDRQEDLDGVVILLAEFAVDQEELGVQWSLASCCSRKSSSHQFWHPV